MPVRAAKLFGPAMCDMICEVKSGVERRA